MWPRQESNLDLELRKLLYYPLYYEANMSNYLLPCNWSFVPTVLWRLYYPPDSYREYYKAGLVYWFNRLLV